MRIFDSGNEKNRIAASPTQETGLLGNIIDAIKTVWDPEIPVNLYDLGLIYRIDLDDAPTVRITMTLTNVNCPVADELPRQVQAAAQSVDGVDDCKVSLVWDPPWTRDKMSEEALFALGLI